MKLITSSQIISALPYLIAFSGWAKILYDWYTDKPKIKGKIINVLTGHSGPPSFQKNVTTFLIYLYITNTRKNTVNVLDYSLEIETNSCYEQVDRVYGAHNITNWTFQSGTKTMEINDFPSKLITANAEPVEYGIPLHGWLLFASEKPQRDFDKVKRWKVTCLDAFNNKHVIVTSSKQFPTLALLQDLAGIREIPEEFKRKSL